MHAAKSDIAPVDARIMSERSAAMVVNQDRCIHRALLRGRDRFAHCLRDDLPRAALHDREPKLGLRSDERQRDQPVLQAAADQDDIESELVWRFHVTIGLAVRRLPARGCRESGPSMATQPVRGSATPFRFAREP